MSESESSTLKTARVGALEIEIPGDWETLTLQKITELSGSGEWGEETESASNNREALVLRSGDITLDGDLSKTDIATRYLSESNYEQYEIKPLDIVIVTSSGSEKHIGKKWLAPETLTENKYHYTNFLYRIRLNKSRCSPRFIYYFLNSDYERTFLQSITPTSTGLQNLDTDSYEELTVPLPPLPEQRRIAEILSTVDELIQQTNEIIEKATEIRKGVLNDLLSKGVNEAQLKKVKLGPINRSIPNTWEVVELRDITGRLTNGISKSQNFEGDGFPVTRIETIADEVVNLSAVGWIDDDSSGYEDYQIRNNDILFSHINSLDHIGKAAQYRGKEGVLYHGMNLLLIRFDWNLIHPLFAYIYMTAPFFRKLCRSFAKKAVNQVSLNQSDVGKLPLLLPSYYEQEMIAQRIECIDRKLRSETQQKQHLGQLKRGLMQDLLTGKVRVPVKT